MSSELSTIISLRRVLESASQGMGMAQSMVREFGRRRGDSADSARLLLLGYPLVASLRPLIERNPEEVSMLSSLIANATGSSAPRVGRSGEALSLTLERWVKAQESRRMEQKVMSFRGLITSGVLGAVTAMIASLGPVVGSLSLLANQGPTGGGVLIPAAAGMVAIGSGMLGFYLSGRGLVANVFVSLVVFAVIAALASPLSNVPFAPWGVK